MLSPTEHGCVKCSSEDTESIMRAVVEVMRDIPGDDEGDAEQWLLGEPVGWPQQE